MIGVYGGCQNSQYFPDTITVRIAHSLIEQECPVDWLRVWPGPDNPRRYLRAVVTKTAGLQKLQQGQLLSAPVDLSLFFHPEALLKAVKQLTARSVKIRIPIFIFGGSIFTSHPLIFFSASFIFSRDICSKTL